MFKYQLNIICRCVQVLHKNMGIHAQILHKHISRIVQVLQKQVSMGGESNSIADSAKGKMFMPQIMIIFLLKKAYNI